MKKIMFIFALFMSVGLFASASDGKIKKIETLKLSKIELPKENLKKSNPLVQYQITIHCGVSGVINIVICCYSCYSCAQHDAPLWAEALCF